MNKMPGPFSEFKGRRAMLHSLQKRPELNDIPGTLGDFLESKFRFEFFPDHAEKYAAGMKRMEVKLNNLRPLPKGTEEVVNISGVLKYLREVNIISGEGSQHLGGGGCYSGDRRVWMPCFSVGEMQHGRDEILDAVRNAVATSRKIIDKTDAIAMVCRGLEPLDKDDSPENFANQMEIYRRCLSSVDLCGDRKSLFKSVMFLFLTPETRTAVQTLSLNYTRLDVWETGWVETVKVDESGGPRWCFGSCCYPSFLVFYFEEGKDDILALQGEMQDTLDVARRKVLLRDRFFLDFDGILIYDAGFLWDLPGG